MTVIDYNNDNDHDRRQTTERAVSSVLQSARTRSRAISMSIHVQLVTCNVPSLPGKFSSALLIPSEVYFQLRLESAHRFAL